MDAAQLKRALDLFRSNQWPRRIVHGDIVRVAINLIQTRTNRILPAFAAGHDGPHFFEAGSATDFSDFIMSFLTPYDYDFAYRTCMLERTNCMSDHRFASDYSEQFIEPHALAAAAGYDDC